MVIPSVPDARLAALAYPRFTGLFAAAIPSIIYAFMGQCRQMGLGPEASLSLMTGTAVQNVLGTLSDDVSPHQRLKVASAVASLVTFEVGLITFLLGLFRLGFLDAVLGRPLLRGFVTAIVRSTPCPLIVGQI
jgi:MFS superfamily sulfate permease-like transporter